MDRTAELDIQEGGKLLDKGVYGCIFQPPLLCKRGKKRPNGKKLGKLTSLWSIEHEIDVAKHFEGNKEARQYMILPELDTLCNPKVPASQTEKDIGLCEPIETFGYEKMMQYEVRYGGKALYLALESLKREDNFSFFRFMGQLLEIGAFCTLHGLVHNDLHAGNVLVDKDFRPMLIDFGRSYFPQKLNKQKVESLKAQYMPDIDQTPPESSIEDGLHGGHNLEFLFADVAAKKPSLLYAERYLGLSRQKQMQQLRSFWASSKVLQRDNWTMFWKLYWPSSDSWGIGTMLLWILRKLLFSKDFTESREWSEKGGVVRSVLRGMLQASPRERIDCVEALALYDPGNDLITGDLGSEWLDKRAARREQLRVAAAF